jgi:hypothetical protein
VGRQAGWQTVMPKSQIILLLKVVGPTLSMDFYGTLTYYLSYIVIGVYPQNFLLSLSFYDKGSLP